MLRVGCSLLVSQGHHIVYAYRVAIVRIDFTFSVRTEQPGVCVTFASSFCEGGELWGSVANIVQKRSVQRTNALMDSIPIRGPFHVRRELASEVGDQRCDLTLSIIGGSPREFLE